MGCIGRKMPPELRQRFGDFLAGRTGERTFACHTGHPCDSTGGFCYMDLSFPARMLFYVKAGLLGVLLGLPFDRLSIWYLRRLGARVGKRVSLSPGVWIDPMYPELLTIEDGVFVGTGAKIGMHDFDTGGFRAGNVILRKGSLIGAFAIVGCGVEVGQGATVAAGAVVRKDVPADAVAIGNPARIVYRDSGEGQSEWASI